MEALVDLSPKLRGEIQDMCRKTVQMLKLTSEGFRKQSYPSLQNAEKIGKDIHQREKELTETVVRKLTGPAGSLSPEQEFYFLPMHLERIGDNTELLVRAIQMMVREGIPFSDRAIKEIETLFEKSIELLECAQDVILTRNRILIRHIQDEGRRQEQLADEFALVHQQRLIEGVCMPKSSSVYLAILDYLKGIEWHTRLIAQKLSAVPSG